MVQKENYRLKTGPNLISPQEKRTTRRAPNGQMIYPSIGLLKLAFIDPSHHRWALHNKRSLLCTVEALHWVQYPKPQFPNYFVCYGRHNLYNKPSSWVNSVLELFLTDWGGISSLFFVLDVPLILLFPFTGPVKEKSPVWGRNKWLNKLHNFPTAQGCWKGRLSKPYPPAPLWKRNGYRFSSLYYGN